MNTEKAIDFLDDVFSRCRLKKCNLQNLNSIVCLLVQGEMYKQMWEELRDNYKIKHYYWVSDGVNERKIYLGETLGEIEQKYFSEKGKNNV